MSCACCLLILSALAAGPGSAEASAPPTRADAAAEVKVEDEQVVRIAVGRFQGALTLSGPNLELRAGDGRRFPVSGPIVLAADATGIRLAGRRIDAELLRISTEGEIVLRSHRYKRHLEVSWRSYRGRPELLVVHPLPMETYVAGIVGSELPHKWPYEAKKAQAVAARTYAVWQKYRRLDLPYHMESSVLDQVYHGAEREHPESVRAAAETRGVILTWGRRPAQAYFHAACGDKMESAKEGWGNDLPYLPDGTCGFCRAAPRYQWSAEVSWKELDAALHTVLGAQPKTVKIVGTSKTGRATKVLVTGGGKKRVITGGDLRRLVGYTKLWSTWINTIVPTDKGLVFRGKGAGHGIGMCQWGARGMAEGGQGWEAILERYYPGAHRTRMY
jgi:stage II sporulation protein D